MAILAVALAFTLAVVLAATGGGVDGAGESGQAAAPNLQPYPLTDGIGQILDPAASAVPGYAFAQIQDSVTDTVSVRYPAAFVTTWGTTGANQTITIPATGSYTIDWGDGTVNATATGTQQHTYAAVGNHTVAITGGLESINLAADSASAAKLKSIDQWGNITWTTMAGAFRGASNMAYNAADTPDLSGVTSMDSMFRDTSSFDGDLSTWDVLGVTNMDDMFTGADSFQQNLGNWYVVLDSTEINAGDAPGIVGTISTQNPALAGQNPTYGIGTRGDSALFEIAGGTGLRMTVAPTKSLYTVDVTSTGDFGTSNHRVYSVTVADLIPIPAPATPVPVASVTNGDPGFLELGSAFEVTTVTIDSDTYALVTAHGSDGVQIIDITDPSNPGPVASFDEGDTAGGKTFDVLVQPRGIATATIGSSTYALIAALGDNGVQIVDITNPATPVPVASVTDGAGGFDRLHEPFGIDIATIGPHTYAAVTGAYDHGVQIINITDPANPTPAASVTDGVGGFTELHGAEGITVTTIGPHTYALVAAYEDHGVQIINITDPANPTPAASISDNSNGFDMLRGATSVAVTTIDSHTYALVTGHSENGIQIIDITDPSNPEPVASFEKDDTAGGKTFDVLDAPFDIATVKIGTDTYALITAQLGNGIQIVDITNPSKPKPVISLVDGDSIYDRTFDELLSPRGIAITTIGSNAYALVAASFDHGVQIIDLGPVLSARPPDGAFITTWEATSADKTITIPVGGAAGSYDVYWGDGSATTHAGDATHTYGRAGTYTVGISGDFTRMYLAEDSTNAAKLQSIEKWGDIGWTTMAGAFRGASNMEYNAADSPDLSGVSDMSSMFRDASKFNGDISGWDVSGVTNMDDMFTGADSFRQNLGNWYIVLDSTEIDAGDIPGIVGTMSAQNPAIAGQNPTYGIGIGGDFDSFEIAGGTSLNMTVFPDLPLHTVNVTSTGDFGTSNHHRVYSVTVTDLGVYSLSPAPTASISDNRNGYQLNAVTDIAVTTIGSSTYALVAASGDDVVQIIDITNPASPALTASVTDGAGGFDELKGAEGIAVTTIGSSTYALVAASGDDGVQIIDITNPASPARVASVTDGAGGFDELKGAEGIAVTTIGSSTYALVAASGDDGVQIIDITNPASPARVASVTDGAGGFDELKGAEGIAVTTIGSSTYALVAASGDDGVQIIDITNPASPARVASVTDGAGGFDELKGAEGIAVTTIGSSTYALVAASGDDGVQIIDITNPASPARVASVTDGAGGFDVLDAPSDITTIKIGTGTYALVAASGSQGGVQIIDITDPASPAPAASARDNERVTVGGAERTFDELLGPTGITTVTIGSDTYALVAAQSDSGVQIIDLRAAFTVTAIQSTPDVFATAWKTTSPNESITIPGTGTYDIDWGDGTTSGNVTGPQTHVYDDAGTYAVFISGDLGSISLAGNTANAAKLQSIVQWGNTEWTTMAGAFRGASNMVYNADDSPDLSGVSDMSLMFRDASKFNGDLSGWNVSGVTNMKGMFNRASTFNGDLSGWNVSGVTDMKEMFNGASAFNGNISSWNVSGVTNMNEMFNGASAFNGNISSWDVSGVTDMFGMFNGASAFNGNISSWNVSGVTDMFWMFRNAASFNGDISAWDVSGVTNMFGMFNGASAFNGDISAWNVSGVGRYNMFGMFSGADSFRQNLGNWYVVLDSTEINAGDAPGIVGTISAQNPALAGQNPTYGIGTGGDFDSFEIAGGTSLNMTVSPDKSPYTVNVTSTGGFGTSNHRVYNVTVTSLGANTSPTVDAGNARDAAEGSTVSLGATVTDTDTEDALTYSWTHNSTLTIPIDDSTALDTSFTAPNVAEDTPVEFTLTVGDGTVTVSDTVVITITDSENAAPTVSAGNARDAAEGSTVSLGATVTDTDTEDALTYSWTHNSTLTIPIDDSTALDTSFTAPNVAEDTPVEFTLTVGDGTVTVSDTVVITITDSENAAPTVSAGNARDAAEGSTVSLGATVTDTDTEDALTYSWTHNSTLTIPIDDSTALDTSFTAPNVAEDTPVEFTLTVGDGTVTVSDTVVITITDSENAAPTVSAGNARDAAEGSTVSLGATVTDTDTEDALTYSWTHNSTLTIPIDDSTALDTSFTAPNVAEDTPVEFTLTVGDGTVTVSDTVVITITDSENAAPTVSAGNARDAAEGSTVSLGATVTDTDTEDALTYSWTHNSTLTIPIDDSTALDTSFTAPNVAEDTPVEFTLTVGDGTVTVSDTVVITITDSENAAPTVSAGNARDAAEGSTVSLGATVTDTDTEDALTYSWTHNSTLTIPIDDSTALDTSFTAPNVAEDTPVEFTLTVGDGTVTVSDTVVITITDSENAAPTVSAGNARDAAEGSTVSLGATVTDTDTEDALTYSWTHNSTLTIPIDDSTALDTSFTAPNVAEDTPVEFTLTVGDGTVTVSDTVVITITDSENAAPTVSAGNARDAAEGSTVSLGATVTDTDTEDALTYSWTHNSTLTIPIDDSTALDTSFTAPNVAEDTPVEFTLTVGDGTVTVSDTVVITITDSENAAPTVSAGNARDAAEGSTVSLGATVTDTDTEDALTYSWTHNSTLTIPIDDSTALDTSFTAPNVAEDTPVEFTLTVGDGTVTVSDTVVITITDSENAAPTVSAGNARDAAEGSTVSLGATVTDTDTEDALTYSWTHNSTLTIPIDDSTALDTSFTAPNVAEDTPVEFTLTVGDGTVTVSDTVVITITDSENAAPTVSAGNARDAAEGSTVSLGATVTDTDTEDALTYSWTHNSTLTIPIDDSTALDTSFTAPNVAEDTPVEFTLTVGDGTVTVSDTVVITITDSENAAPTVSAGNARDAAEGSTVSLGATVTDTDTEDALTYSWTHNSTLTIPIDDSTALDTSFTAPNVAEDTPVEFTLTVGDGTVTVSDTVVITITDSENAAPTVSAGNARDAAEGSTVSLGATVTDTDTEDALTYSWTHNSTLTIPIDDSTALDTSFTAPNVAEDTPVEFTLTVGDGTVTVSDTVVITITDSENAAPTVSAGNARDAAEGSTVSLGATVTDTDTEDALTYSWTHNSTLTIPIDDSTALDTSFTAPNVAEDTPVEFTLTVGDGTVTVSDTVVITITDSENAAPTVSAGNARDAAEGSTVSLGATVTDTDTEDALTYSWTHNSTLTIPIDDSTALDTSFTAPNVAEDTPVEFTLTVGDGTVTVSDTVVITITDSENAAPTVSAGNARDAAEGSTVSLGATVTDTDTEDALTYSWTHNSTLTIPIDDSTALDTSFTAPNVAEDTPVEFTLTVGDGTVTVSDTVVITITDSENAAPTVSAGNARDAAEGSTVSLGATVTDTDTEDALTYSWTHNSTLTIPIDDSTALDTSFTAPNVAEDTPVEFTLTVGDGTVTVSDTVVITITDSENAAPTVSAGNARDAAEGSTVSLGATVTDTDTEDALTYSWTHNSTLTIPIDDSTALDTSFTAPNVAEDTPVEFTLTVGDGTVTVSDTVVITITDSENAAPTVSAGNARDAAEGSTVSLGATVTDTDTEDALTYSWTHNSTLTIPIDDSTALDTSFTAPNVAEDTPVEFTLTVGDGTVTVSDTVVITITDSENAAPTVSAGNARDAAEGSTVSLGATVTDTDTEDALTYSWTHNSTLTIPIDDSTALDTSFTAPNVAEDTPVEFTLTVGDGTVTVSDTVVITITDSENAAPTVSAGNARDAAEGSTVSLGATVTDTDTEDALTYSWTHNSTLTIPIDDSTALDTSFTAPNVAEDTPVEFTLTVGDGTVTVSDTVVITITDSENAAPTVSAGNARDAAEGSTVSLGATVTDTDTEDALTYSWTHNSTLTIPIDDSTALDTSFTAPNVAEDTPVEFTLTVGDGTVTVSDTVVITITDSENAAPTVSAGNARDAAEGSTVSLGATVTDTDTEDALTYSWTHNSTLTIPIDDSTALDTSFTAPNVAEDTPVEFTLTVGDGTVTVSDTVVITITDSENAAPTVSAGNARDAAEGSTVSLGATVTDTDTEDALTYSWTHNSTLTIPIDDSTALDTSFTAPNVAEDTPVEFTLTVGDGTVTVSDTVVITITDSENAAPTVSAGNARDAAEGSTVSLGATVTDTDTEDALTYSWTHNSTLTIPIDDSTALDTSFTAPNVAEDTPVEFTLTVGDGTVTVSDTVVITITDSENAAPTVSAGNARDAAEGSTVSLGATVTDTDTEDALTYSWTHNSTLTIPIDDSTALDTSFTAPNVAEDTPVEFTLTVGDGTVTVSDTVVITITDSENAAPTVTSIARSDPAEATTSERTLVFAVTFSEDVTGVDSADFALSPESTGGTGGGTGSGQFTQTRSPALAITQANTVSDTIAVTDTGNATSVSVAIDITHTYIGDLKVDLIAPDGTTKTLHNRSGGTTDDIDQTYAPNFDGVPIAGTWTLRVNDNYAAADDGVLNSWTLTINHGSTASPVTTVSGSGSTYYATVSAAQDGTYNLDLVSSGHEIADTASNPLTDTAPTGADHTYTVSTIPVDTTFPTVSSIERFNPSSATTDSQTLIYQVTFSENVTGVDAADFALSPGSTGGGTSTSGQFTQTRSPALAITQANTVSDTIAVTDTGNATSVSVAIDITHTYIGDLKVDLIAPDGTTKTLHNRSGGTTDDIDQTYAPNFDGVPIAGTWTLRVNDNYAAADDGVLNSWTLTINHGGSSTASPVTTVSGSGSTYYATVSAAQDGTYNLDLVSSGHEIADTASNPLTDTAPTGADHTYTVSTIPVDTTFPTVSSIERFNPSSATTDSQTLIYQVTFSENVTGVDAADFALSPGSTGGGTSTSGQFTQTRSPALAITQANTVSDTIAVTDTGNATSVSVAIDITHTYIGDLKVDLIAPDGTTKTLHNRSGGTTDDIDQTYAPNFDGVPIAGTWTLRVNDNYAAADDGVLNSWTLTINHGGSSTASHVTTVSGSGSTYYATVSAAQDGTYNLDLVSSGHEIADTASNPLTDTAPTGADHTYTVSTIPVDTTFPTVSSIERHDPASENTDSQTLIYRVTFSENVTGVDAADFALSLGSTGGGTSTSGQFTQTRSPALAITEDNTVSDTITVTDTGNATSVSVAIDITHTYIGDLKVDLIAPDGTTKTLHNRSGGTTDDIDQTYAPNFDGVPIAGTWTLRVNDNYAAADDGVLNSWTLTINHGGSSTASPVTTVSGSGSTYYATVSAAQDGTYNLDLVSSGHEIADTASNPLTDTAPTGADHTYTVSTIPVDTTFPTVSSIERFNPSSATTDSQTLIYQVTFSENVTGVDAADFALSPGSTGGGTSTSGQFTQTRSPALAITQANTVSDTITVTDTGNATSVSVAIDITHTYIGDLKVDLIAPDGTTKTLHNRSGGTTDDIDQTYAPNFDGVPIAGTWTLRVNDNYAAADDGVLNSWTLTINHGGSSTASHVTTVSGSGSTYYATVSAAQDGTYNLDLVSSGHEIADTASNPLADTTPTGADHTYTVSTTVADVTDPVITVSGDTQVTVQVDVAYSDAGADCVDNVDPDPTLAVSNPVDTSTAGTYTVTYICTDASGNDATATRAVAVEAPVQDTAPPTVVSITRSDPAVEVTNSTSLVFQVIFSENVTDVDAGDFVLSPDSTGEGGASGQFAQTRSPALAITQANTVSDTIAVTDTGNATSVSVAIDITHTYIGDLKVDLIAPDGTTKTLHNRSGGTTDDIDQTYAPNFDGVPIAGTWTLRVNDNYAAADDGVLNSWTLTINHGGSSTASHVTTVSGSGSTYYATVSAAQDGTYNLDLVSSGHEIADTASNPLTDTTPAGADHTYTVSTTVADVTDPVITVSGDTQVTVQVDVAYSDAGADCVDNADPDPTLAVSNPVDTSTAGTYTVTYICTDASGNDATATRAVAVEAPVQDTAPPTVVSITRSDPAVEVTNSTSLVFQVIFSENVTDVDAGDFVLSPDSTGEGGASGQFAQTRSPALAITQANTVSDTIAVTDTGNATSVSVAIDITHTYIGDLKVDLIAPDGTTKTLHNRSGGTTDDIDQTYAPNFDGVPIAGTWTLRVNDNYAAADDGVLNSWTLTINHGGSSTASHVTTVSGSGSTYYATVSAAQDGTYNLDLVSSGHEIADTASNPLTDTTPAGADHTYTVSTTVADVTDPVITVSGDTQVTVQVDVAYSDAGADCVDNADPDPTLAVSNPVDTSTAGTYTVTYTCTDASGNDATATRAVAVEAPVQDTAPPTVVSITRSDPAVEVTNSTSLVFQVIFSENVTDVDAGDFVLSPDSTGEGGASGQFAQTSEPAAPIPDRGTIQDAIAVEQPGTATSVSVAVDITHSYIGDLVIDLIAPDGTTRTLHDRTGYETDDIDQTYAPDFGGVGIEGDWTLRVRDGAGGDTGTLNGWTLTINHGSTADTTNPVTSVSGSGDTYLVTVSASTDGTYNLDLASGHSIADEASNPLADTAPTGADHTYIVSTVVV